MTRRNAVGPAVTSLPTNPSARIVGLDALKPAADRWPWTVPFAMWGALAIAAGLATYSAGVLLVVPRFLGFEQVLRPISEWLVWYSGMPIVAGATMTLFDVLFLLESKRRRAGVRLDGEADEKVTVALTAYNDEDSITTAVSDFRRHPRVGTVIVVSNNSTDDTFGRAQRAGALTFNEERQGYGRCVHRCLTEAVRLDESSLIVLCEGDRTFRAHDIDKLLAYAMHGDIVQGTRTSEVLRQNKTQLTTFVYYGNLAVGKLLEFKHLGRGTLTDVGTTYKLCRRDALVRLLPKLRPRAVNLEFNAHLLDVALTEGLTIVECPITFHQRVGESKGGNANNWRALRVGLCMIAGIVLGWKEKRGT